MISSPPSLPSRASGSGAVLLEALVALAVFAIAVLGLAKAMDAAVQNASEARLAAAITREMENALEEMLHQPSMEPGEWTVERTPKDSLLPEPLIITTTITEAEQENDDGEPLDGIYEVLITGVTKDRRQREQKWELRTLCYPPLYAGQQ